MKLQQSFKKLKGAFSLVETLITLIVVCIIIIMLTNVLAITLKVSILVSERSHIKNELSNIFQKLDRDVANAEYIFIDEANNALILETTEYRIRWERCKNDHATLTSESEKLSLCQYYCPVTSDDMGTVTCPANTSRLQTKTSPKLVISSFIINEINSTSAFENQRIKSAVVTIRAEHYTDRVNKLTPERGLGITNLFKQISISSNNFII
ncbi:hypothetical protein KBD45_00565 [Candidatus Dojkabacteria bacterium]|nr:hypothetical protein [Candidatus Dojkabacteria bacterium]